MIFVVEDNDIEISSPTGNIYNAGTWTSAIPHGLLATLSATASELTDRISITLPNRATCYAGIIVGPIKFGNSYSAIARGPNSYNNQILLGAYKNIDDIAVVDQPSGIDYSDDSKIYTIINATAGSSNTLTINTSVFKGKVGYVVVFHQVFNYSYARAGGNITQLSAT